MRDKANDDSQIAGHLQQLGLTLDPAAVEARMPSVPLISRLRELARGGQAVLTDWKCWKLTSKMPERHSRRHSISSTLVPDRQRILPARPRC